MDPKTLPIMIAASAALTLSSQGAGYFLTLFKDDFEAGTNIFTTDPTAGGYSTTPNVNAGDNTNGSTNGQPSSRITNTEVWVRASQGFGGSEHGLVDETVGGAFAFTDPTGEQAYAFRYSNSGLTSSAGLLGASGDYDGTLGGFDVGQTITLSFDVVTDGPDQPWRASLVTFDGAASRNDARGGGASNGASSLLATANGSAPASGAYQNVSFSYTITGTEATGLLDDDVAIRFFGATTSANIDNVVVTVSIPEPSVALLGAFGGLLLLRRRR